MTHYRRIGGAPVILRLIHAPRRIRRRRIARAASNTWRRAARRGSRRRRSNVRVTLDSGHRADMPGGPSCAISGLLQCKILGSDLALSSSYTEARADRVKPRGANRRKQRNTGTRILALNRSRRIHSHRALQSQAGRFPSLAFGKAIQVVPVHQGHPGHRDISIYRKPPGCELLGWANRCVPGERVTCSGRQAPASIPVCQVFFRWDWC